VSVTSSFEKTVDVKVTVGLDVVLAVFVNRTKQPYCPVEVELFGRAGKRG
jgi:hypothetical protein